MLLSILSWLYIPDFPDKNRFLTREQTEFVLQRIELDRGDSVPDPITFEKARLHLSDWRLWAYGKLFFSENVSISISSDNRCNVFMRHDAQL